MFTFNMSGPDERFGITHPAEHICRIMARIYDLDMTSLSGGNISVMDNEGVMWVTPTGIDKKLLEGRDIVRVLPDGTCDGSHRPTSEYYIHRKIYERRPDIKAVIHAHAPATVALSLLGRVPQTRLYEAAYRTVGEPALTAYEVPGSMRLADCVSDAFAEGYDSAILEKHSSFVGSRTGLDDAYKRFEMLDFAARVEIIAHLTGRPDIPSEDMYSSKGIFYSTVFDEYPVQGSGSSEREMSARLREFVKRGYGRGLFGAAFGVMSVRTGGDNFVICRSGCDNGELTEEDIVAVRDGRRPEGKLPHVTAPLHSLIYKMHPETGAVIISSPVYTMGYLAGGSEYSTRIYPESYWVLGDARRYPYERLLTMEGLKEIASGLDHRHPMAMVEHCGVILAGADAEQVYDRLEVCEYSARSMYNCQCMGQEPVVMTPEQIRELS